MDELKNKKLIQGLIPGLVPSAGNEYLTVGEAAEYLRISPKTLERWRVDGSGPQFFKAGPGLRSRVLYRQSDLENWLEGFVYKSTSEYS